MEAWVRVTMNYILRKDKKFLALLFLDLIHLVFRILVPRTTPNWHQERKVRMIHALLCTFFSNANLPNVSFHWTIPSNTVVIDLLVIMNLTLQYFFKITTKPRIMKIEELWKHKARAPPHSSRNWLLSFIFCLFLISFTLDFPWAHPNEVVFFGGGQHISSNIHIPILIKSKHEGLWRFGYCVRGRLNLASHELGREKWRKICGNWFYSEVRKVGLYQSWEFYVS